MKCPPGNYGFHRHSAVIANVGRPAIHTIARDHTMPRRFSRQWHLW